MKVTSIILSKWQRLLILILGPLPPINWRYKACRGKRVWLMRMMRWEGPFCNFKEGEVYDDVTETKKDDGDFSNMYKRRKWRSQGQRKGLGWRREQRALFKPAERAGRLQELISWLSLIISCKSCSWKWYLLKKLIYFLGCREAGGGWTQLAITSFRSLILHRWVFPMTAWPTIK